MMRFLGLTAFLAGLDLMIGFGSAERLEGTLVNAELLRVPPKTNETWVPEPKCQYAIEMTHLQDVSQSYEDDMANLREFFPRTMTEIAKRNKDSKFAFASFIDKPLPRRGWGGAVPDYCLRVHKGLQDQSSGNATFLDDVSPGGGKDWQEAQLDAMFRALVNKKIGWSRPGTLAEDGSPVVRVLVVATDSYPHFAPDALDGVKQFNAKNPSSQQMKLPTPHRIGEVDSPVIEDENAMCAEWDYPELEELGAALRDKDIFVVFMLAPADFTGACPYGEGKCTFEAMRDEAEDTGDRKYLDPVIGMKLGYESFLKDMGTPGYVMLVDDQMSDYLDAINEVLKVLDDQVCHSGNIPAGTGNSRSASPRAAVYSAPFAAGNARMIAVPQATEKPFLGTEEPSFTELIPAVRGFPVDDALAVADPTEPAVHVHGNGNTDVQVKTANSGAIKSSSVNSRSKDTTPEAENCGSSNCECNCCECGNECCSCCHHHIRTHIRVTLDLKPKDCIDDPERSLEELLDNEDEIVSFDAQGHAEKFPKRAFRGLMS